MFLHGACALDMHFGTIFSMDEIPHWKQFYSYIESHKCPKKDAFLHAWL